MTHHVPLETLVYLLAANEHLALVQSLQRSKPSIAYESPLPVDDLARIYRVRLSRWKETGLPPSEGLEGVMRGFEARAGGRALVLGHQDQEVRYVIVVTAELDTLIGVIEVRQ